MNDGDQRRIETKAFWVEEERVWLATPQLVRADSACSNEYSFCRTDRQPSAKNGQRRWQNGRKADASGANNRKEEFSLQTYGLVTRLGKNGIALNHC